MDLEQRALPLIDTIYAAAAEPDRWQQFVEAFSEALDGAAVGFGLLEPGDPLAGTAYLHQIEPEYRRSFPEELIRGLPYAGQFGPQSSKRFSRIEEFFPDIELAESEFYHSWMKPQGLAPQWWIGCGIWRDGQVPLAWTYAWRFEDRPFGPADVALGDLLVPHLHRALSIHGTLQSSRHQHRALGEVMDRLPTGVILLDRNLRAISKNQAAERILELDDGFTLGERGPAAGYCSRARSALKRLLDTAVDPDPGKELESGGFVAIERPSGKRAFVCMVTPLLAAPSGAEGGDAAIALFISDPEAGRVSETQVIATVYQLTHAEAELVRLLSSGLSLEQVAEKRGVTMNTARGQLKQVFAKTDTKRQGELVRLVLMGVGTMHDG